VRLYLREIQINNIVVSANAKTYVKIYGTRRNVAVILIINTTITKLAKDGEITIEVIAAIIVILTPNMLSKIAARARNVSAKLRHISKMLICHGLQRTTR
jgi:hypothetical protein